MSMNSRIPPRVSGALALAILSLSLPHTRVQEPQAKEKETVMTVRAQGSFKVEMLPLAEDDGWGGFARMSIDKKFEGELEGESKGVMLAAHTEVKGSAGYVAFERVTGKLAGRSGSFILQHSGMMWEGGDRLTISVVTDSGTGELKGLSGSFEIIFSKEGHEYVFEYGLPDSD